MSSDSRSNNKHINITSVNLINMSKVTSSWQDYLKVRRDPQMTYVQQVPATKYNMKRVAINADLKFTFPPASWTFLLHMYQLPAFNSQLLRSGAFIRRNYLNYL